MGKTYDNKLPSQLGFKYTERVVADDRTEVQSLSDLANLIIPPYFVTFVRNVPDENGLPTGFMWNGQDQSDLSNWINPLQSAKQRITNLENSATAGIVGTVTPNTSGDNTGIPQLNGVDITLNGYYRVDTAGWYGTVEVTSGDLESNFVTVEVRNIETTATYDKSLTNVGVDKAADGEPLKDSEKIHTGKQIELEMALKVDKTNVLEKDNTTPFTPTADYHPATLKTVKDLQIVQTSTGDYLIVDKEYNAVFRIENLTGKTDFIPSESLKSKILTDIFFRGIDFQINDDNGNTAFKVSKFDGKTDFTPSKNLINKITPTFKDISEITIPAQILHVITYGQSLSCGYDAFPIQSDTQKYDALMFNSGVIYDEDDFLTNTTSFSPLIEQVTNDSNSQGETPASGIADAIKDYCERLTGVFPENQDFQILVTCCGVGGENIEDLIPTATAFERVENAIDKGYSLATALGKSYKVIAIPWLQGESNPSQDIATTTYKNNLKLIQSGVDAYAKSVTGQTEDVPLFTYQTCTGLNPAIAQLELSNEDELVQCTGSIYAFKQNLIHFSGSASYDYGYQIGRFVFERIFNDTIIKPLEPTDIVVRDNDIFIRFSDSNYKIELDNSWDLMYGDQLGKLYDVDKDYNLDYYKDKSNYGLSMYNDSDEEIITLVEKYDDKTLKITCSESPNGFLLKYASKRYTMLEQGGSYFGNRTYGGIYAEMPLSSQTTNGSNNRIWCVQFIKQL